MNKNITVWAILANIIWAICFTVLAVVFHKWWIVLVAVLFEIYINANLADMYEFF